MSTTYFTPADPITSLRVTKSEPHTIVTFFCNHANVGHLCLRNDEVAEFLMRLKGTDAFHVHYGGDERGCVVEKLTGQDLPMDAILISESGQTLTVSEVLQKQGFPVESQQAV